MQYTAEYPKMSKNTTQIMIFEKFIPLIGDTSTS